MQRRFALYHFPLYLEADSGTGGGGSGDVDPKNDDNDGGEGTTDTPAASGKTFTQADIDRIVQTEKRKAAAAERKRIEDEAKTAAMSETDRLKAEKEAATKQAKDAIDAANNRIVKAEAKVKALEIGVKPERVTAALKLADLSAVEVGDDGEPDADAISAAVTAMLAEYPEFKVAAGNGGNVGGGSNPAGGGGKEPTLDEQYEAAQKAGNVTLMVAIKRKIFEAQQKKR